MADRFILRTPLIRDNAIQAVKDLPLDGTHEVVIQAHKSKRSRAQNDLMWTWFELLANETGYTKDNWHEYFKAKFIAPETEMLVMFDKTIPSQEVTTTKKNVKQFTEYLQRIELWVMDNMGYSFPVTDDYKLAMKGLKNE